MRYKSRDPKYGGAPTPSDTSYWEKDASAPKKVVLDKSASQQDIDWKGLFLDLWTSLQGTRDCLTTWEEDREWAEQNPCKAYPGSKSEGLGRRFQMFQFKHRLNWDDLEPLVEEIRRIEKLKIAHRNQVDTRGYVK